MRKYMNEEKLENLKIQINELRENLNEICAVMDKNSDYQETLRLSMCMDELINEYMKTIN